MKLTRVLPLLALLALLPACAGFPGSSRYTRFHSTNLRGETIAEWTARGFYYRTSEGYRITAVERVSGPPFRHVSRYPHGRKSVVTGPVIEKGPAAKPAWLNETRLTEIEYYGK